VIAEWTMYVCIVGTNLWL